MRQGIEKRVFISYVHEDNAAVNHLCAVLESSKIPYWRDRNDLGPGDAWKARIHEAIREGAVVFLACFSHNSRTKIKSHMNEELTLAVEEFRKLSPGRNWLIPIRFDAGEVPEWDLGAGRTLSDLNYVDLFDDTYAIEVAKLVTAIHEVMGHPQLGAAAALKAIEQATSADRVNLMKQCTKDMVPDPARRIELDDLVSQEVQRIITVISDPQRVAGPSGLSSTEWVVRLANEAQSLFELTEPFCASLQVAARWGSPETLTPWAEGIQKLVQAANKPEGGVQGLLNLRHLPGMVAIMSSGLACVAARRWDNLKSLVTDRTIRDQFNSRSLSLLEATDPYKPFDASDWTPQVLARSAQNGKSFDNVWNDLFQQRIPKLHTPAAEWLYAALRPIFKEQLSDEDTYAAQFDRAEVVLGVLAQDATNVRFAASPEGGAWGRSYWFGRSTWRAAHRLGNPLEDLQHELATQGSSWELLRDELFGTQIERAKAALGDYAETFVDIGRNFH